MLRPYTCVFLLMIVGGSCLFLVPQSSVSSFSPRTIAALKREEDAYLNFVDQIDKMNKVLDKTRQAMFQFSISKVKVPDFWKSETNEEPIRAKRIADELALVHVSDDNKLDISPNESLTIAKMVKADSTAMANRMVKNMLAGIAKRRLKKMAEAKNNNSIAEQGGKNNNSIAGQGGKNNNSIAGQGEQHNTEQIRYMTKAFEEERRDISDNNAKDLVDPALGGR